LSTGITAIGGGVFHTCALASGGGVKCWGHNLYGELADGTTIDRPTPVDVTGLAVGVTQLAVGGFHACARRADGGVVCWGGGSLGNGKYAIALAAAQVSGLPAGIAAISAGERHTCALTAAGGAKCWGENLDGQLGIGTATNALTPRDVSGLLSSGVVVAAGSYHSCAVTTGGGAACWGSNYYGQLGDGTAGRSFAPVAVTGLTAGVAAVAAGGYHSCALTTGGGVKCWGNNTYGQLGNGTTAQSLVPVDVTGLSAGVVAIAVGGAHSCALTSGGGVKCWGYNLYGQLGNGTRANAGNRTMRDRAS
jgi:alpha-tubulin suppressor-like RCC1 family protein